MTFKNTDKVGFLSSFARLNKSSEKYYAQAWKKIGWATLGISLSILYIFLAVPDLFWKISGLSALTYAFCKFVGRFIVSWDGWNLKTAQFGFFECDVTRRLNPLRKKSVLDLEPIVVCKESENMAIPLAKKLREIKEELKKINNDLQLQKEGKDPESVPKAVTVTPSVIRKREEKMASPKPFTLPPERRIENIVHLPDLKASELVRSA